MLNFDEIYESFTSDVTNKVKNGIINKSRIIDEISLNSMLYQSLKEYLRIETNGDSERFLEDWELVCDFLKDNGFPYTFRTVGETISRTDRSFNVNIYYSDKINQYLKEYCDKNGIDRRNLKTRGKGSMLLAGYIETLGHAKGIKKEEYDSVNDIFVYLVNQPSSDIELFDKILKDFCKVYIEYCKNIVLTEKGFDIMVKKINEKYDDLVSMNMNESFTKRVIKKIGGFGKRKVEYVPEIDPLFHLIDKGMMKIKSDKEKEFSTLLKHSRLIHWYFKDLMNFEHKGFVISWKIDIVSCKDTEPSYLSNDPIYGQDRKELGLNNKFDNKNYSKLRRIYNRIAHGKNQNNAFYTEISPYLNKISNKNAFKKGFMMHECDPNGDLSERTSVIFCYKICKYVLKNLTNQEEKVAFTEYIKRKAEQ